MGDLSNEPSMEEILSSIKRIIAEDSDAAMTSRARRVGGGRAVAPDSAAPGADSEILELTEAVSAAAPDEDTPSEIGADEATASMPTETAMPVQPAARTTPTLASDTTVDASRSALSALSALVVKPEVHGGDTLEGLVREMLKPMLADWLDARLPDMVERLVAQEIARITARG